MTIRVFQGEREIAANNKLLGQFDLVGIAPAPRGMPQIEVTFDIDANGIVNVSARDKATGREQAIRIQALGGLTEQEIERMVKEAETYAVEDRRRRGLIDVRNEADAVVYSVEKNLQEHGGKLSPGDRQDIEQRVAVLKEAMGRDDAGNMRAKLDALNRAAMTLGQAMYADRPADRVARRARAAARRATRVWLTPNSRRSTRKRGDAAPASCGGGR